MPKKPFAYAKSKNFKAIINESFSFNNYEDAKEKLESLKRLHPISNKLSDIYDENSFVLWVAEYKVTEKENLDGYRGNFAKIWIKKLDNEKYTLSLRKVYQDVKYHPTRKRKQYKSPDWGDWFLRRVRKEWRYPSEKEAGKALKNYQERYPLTTVPAHKKLYTGIYSKDYPNSYKKFILEIKQIDDYFIIECIENPEQRRLPRFKIHEVYDSNFLF